jgi:hypothetical protein
MNLAKRKLAVDCRCQNKHSVDRLIRSQRDFTT